MLRESAFSATKWTSCSNAKQLTQIDVDSSFSRRQIILETGLHVKRENFRLSNIFIRSRVPQTIPKESIREIGVPDKFELNRLACGDPEFRITAANLFSFQDYWFRCRRRCHRAFSGHRVLETRLKNWDDCPFLCLKPRIIDSNGRFFLSLFSFFLFFFFLFVGFFFASWWKLRIFHYMYIMSRIDNMIT